MFITEKIADTPKLFKFGYNQQPRDGEHWYQNPIDSQYGLRLLTQKDYDSILKYKGMYLIEHERPNDTTLDRLWKVLTKAISNRPHVVTIKGMDDAYRDLLKWVAAKGIIRYVRGFGTGEEGDRKNYKGGFLTQSFCLEHNLPMAEVQKEVQTIYKFEVINKKTGVISYYSSKRQMKDAIGLQPKDKDNLNKYLKGRGKSIKGHIIKELI